MDYVPFECAETAIVLPSRQTVVGVICAPRKATLGLPGVILLNAGVVHHVGPNRLYVRIARRLAARGIPVLRLDLPGLGDSRLTLEDRPDTRGVSAVVRVATDHLRESLTTPQWIVGGLCAGALWGLTAALEVEAITGVLWINGGSGDIRTALAPPDREATERARARYHLNRVIGSGSWPELPSPAAAARAAVAMARYGAARIRLTPSRRDCRPDEQPWHEAVAKGTRVLLAYSDGSDAWDAYHLRVRARTRRMRERGLATLRLVRDADHVFTSIDKQVELATIIARWIEEEFGPPPGPRPVEKWATVATSPGGDEAEDQSG